MRGLVRSLLLIPLLSPAGAARGQGCLMPTGGFVTASSSFVPAASYGLTVVPYSLTVAPPGPPPTYVVPPSPSDSRYYQAPVHYEPAAAAPRAPRAPGASTMTLTIDVDRFRADVQRIAAVQRERDDREARALVAARRQNEEATLREAFRRSRERERRLEREEALVPARVVTVTHRVKEAATPVIRGPAGEYGFRAPGPVAITLESGMLTFRWEGGEAVLPLPTPLPEPPEPDDLPPPVPPPVPVPVPLPEPAPDPGPVVPYPPAKPIAWMTFVYDSHYMTSGVAAIRSNQAVRDKFDKLNIIWLQVDKLSKLKDGRFYYQVVGLDRALTEANVNPPALIAQASDGSVLRVRRVPSDEAGARKLIEDFLAIPAGAQEVKP